MNVRFACDSFVWLHGSYMYHLAHAYPCKRRLLESGREQECRIKGPLDSRGRARRKLLNLPHAEDRNQKPLQPNGET